MFSLLIFLLMGTKVDFITYLIVNNVAINTVCKYLCDMFTYSTSGTCTGVVAR